MLNYPNTNNQGLKHVLALAGVSKTHPSSHLVENCPGGSSQDPVADVRNITSVNAFHSQSQMNNQRGEKGSSTQGCVPEDKRHVVKRQ